MARDNSPIGGWYPEGITKAMLPDMTTEDIRKYLTWTTKHPGKHNPHLRYMWRSAVQIIAARAKLKGLLTNA